MSTANTKVCFVLCGGHFLSRELVGDWETPHDYHALTTNLTTALAFSYLSTPLNLSIWSAGQYFLAPSQLLFCDSLSREGKRWSWLALDSNLLSDSPETPFFLNVYSSPFFSSSKLISAWVSSIPFLRPVVPQCPENAGQAHIMPASAPYCWHLDHWGLLGFEIICHTDHSTWARDLKLKYFSYKRQDTRNQLLWPLISPIVIDNVNVGEGI